MDWNSLFGLTQPVAETVVRGSVMYLFLLLLFRLVIRRDVGAIGIADILVLVIIADAAQNGIAGDYRSITDGIILIATIAFWNLLFDWLSFRFPRFGKLLSQNQLQLVRNGRMVHENMRRELMTEEELRSKLREKGVEDISQVKSAYMEPDGAVSVIKRRS